MAPQVLAAGRAFERELRENEWSAFLAAFMHTFTANCIAEYCQRSWLPSSSGSGNGRLDGVFPIHHLLSGGNVDSIKRHLNIHDFAYFPSFIIIRCDTFSAQSLRLRRSYDRFLLALAVVYDIRTRL